MKYGSLSPLGRFIICHFHSHHDVNHSLFWDTETNELFGSQHLSGQLHSSRIRGNSSSEPFDSGGSAQSASDLTATEPVAKPPLHSKKSGERCAISPFIFLELDHLVAEAKWVYNRKRYFVRNIPEYGVLGFLHICFKRFPDAMNCLDRSVDQVESEIHQLESVHQKTILRLTQIRQEKLNRKRLPQAQVYQNALADEQERFTAELVRLYQRKSVLLIEKIRLIELMENRIGRAKERYFFRIRYYYDKACDHSAQQRAKKNGNGGSHTLVLPLHYFTDKELSKLCGGVFDGDYTELLQKAQAMLKETKALLSKLPPTAENKGEGDEGEQEEHE